MAPFAGTARTPPLNLAFGVARTSERVHNLVADFPTAHTQARTDGRHQILGAAAEFGFEGHDCVAHDRRDGSPPAGVHGRDHRTTSVGEENRRAVGDANRDGDIGVVGDDGVGCGAGPGF